MIRERENPWTKQLPTAEQRAEYKRLCTLATEYRVQFRWFPIQDCETKAQVARKIGQLKAVLEGKGIDTTNRDEAYTKCFECINFRPTVGQSGMCRREHAPTKLQAGCYAGRKNNGNK